MNNDNTVIDIQALKHCFGRTEAVNGLDLRVQAGRCYGLFGRNGAGKTTTILCLLNLLLPTSGTVALFGLDPRKHEERVKSRLSYVPDTVAFYPWMSVQDWFEYLASFRSHWNWKLQKQLLERFGLDPDQRAITLSRGEQVQVTLIGALCPEPELLILDEPTSGLDPLVRREFIRTIIGAYQDSDPEHRTVFVSTHLISEFEGLIDEFTVIDQGRALLSMESEAARASYQRIRAWFADQPPSVEAPQILHSRYSGGVLQLVVNGNAKAIEEQLNHYSPQEIQIESLSLEEIFLASLRGKGIHYECQD